MPVAELICVGTEHLLGEVVDTNSPYLCSRLKELGICVYLKQICGDHASRLTEALRLALSRADIVFLIGGLGPTEDDLTRESVCEALGLTLVEDPEILETIRQYFASRNRVMEPCNRRQACRPEGALVLENPRGTAPGLWIEQDQKRIVLLPGPPGEFCPMVDRVLYPLLESTYESVPILTETLRLYGIGESELAARLSGYWDGIGEVSIADYVKDGELTLRLACRDTEGTAKEQIERALTVLRPLISPYLYALGEGTLAHALVDRFTKRGLRFAAAESCTGGKIASLLAGIPGASKVLWGSFVTYTEDAKSKLLGVKNETLEQFGAVSEEVAVEMAQGAAVRSGADLTLSVTGLAGPDGDGVHPVGTVFFAVCYKGTCRAVQKRFSGDRRRIRRDAALYGIALSLKTADLFSIEQI